MKNFQLLRHGIPSIIGILTLLCSFQAIAQYEDDPNRDQLPRELWDRAPQQTDAPLSTTITINNWDNFNLGVDFGESNIASNPLVPAWVATAYNTNDFHHTENGIDWANSTPSFGATMRGDPVVAYDSLGNLFYQNMYGSSIQGVKVIKSVNNGATWGSAVTAVAGVDKNWMACDQTSGPYANYVYVCMTASSGGNFARSTDHGATFTTTFTPSTQSLPGMMVCVGPNNTVQGGAVYVVTNSGSAFNSTYTFYRSTDGGATFSLMSAQTFSNTVGSQVNGRNSVENMRTRPYPFIAADNSYGTNRGRLYCVYASNDPPGNGNKPDIWCRYSDNGGSTWSSAIRVNDDTNPTSHHQWHPGIWCDKETGRLYAMWMDTRDCPTNDSALIYASYSDNGGVSWASNQAISNQKMKINCSTCGGGGTPRYEGDYNGIVSNKKVSIAGWTDFRNGSFMSTTAYFPDFAMSRSPASGTLNAPSDSMDFTVSVPAVKLYTDTVVLTGQVTPAPTTGTITFSYPQGNKITTFPGSKTVRVKVTGSVPASTYQLTFFAKGPNGTPAHQRGATLTVQVSQTLAVSVSATPSTVCSGSSTQLLASVSGGVPAYTYAWTSNPTGFTSNISNPTASPTVDTWYICTVQDNAATTVKDSVLVTVSTLPAAPGAITGNTTLCEGDAEDYSIASVTGATTYTWAVPNGSSILSGQGTTDVSVLWGPNSGDVSVTAGNTCGNSAASVLAVTVSPLPLAPGTITGPTDLCAGASANYSVAVVTGVTNNWTVPADATITSGQGTPAITVLWGSTSGLVSVNAENSCGAGPSNTLNVNVETLPGDAQAISGPDTVCQGEGGYQYSIPVISNATTYTWTLPSGASVSQGQGSNAIVVDFSSSALSGEISVAGNNACGTGNESSMHVDVVVCTGLDENLLQSRVVISPNPVHDLLSVSITGPEKQLKIHIMDVRGHILFEESLENLPERFLRQIDVAGFENGLYLIRLTNERRVFNGKFVKE
ncbi:T9SS type A sorting domain-containing protein [Bacteroidota bacterium]